MSNVDLDFYEAVTVLDTPKARSMDLVEASGVIVGKSEENGVMHYAVQIDGFTYSLNRDDLASTGEKFCREDIYNGDVLRVSIQGDILGGGTQFVPNGEDA